MEIVLVVVNVKDLSKQVSIAQVVFQVQHLLLKDKILVQPPEGLGCAGRLGKSKSVICDALIFTYIYILCIPGWCTHLFDRKV